MIFVNKGKKLHVAITKRSQVITKRGRGGELFPDFPKGLTQISHFKRKQMETQNPKQ